MLHAYICMRIASMQIKASDISLMFAAVKSSLIYATVYIPEDIISSLIFYRRSNSLYIMYFSVLRGESMNYLCHYFCCLIGNVLHNKQPRQQVKN